MRIRYGLLFKRILILLCIVFVVEVGYLDKGMGNLRNYIASLDIPKSPGTFTVSLRCSSKA